MDITDLTLREMVAIGQGIASARAIKNQMGQITSKGLTFPFNIMFTNTYNAGKIKTIVKAWVDGQQELIKQCTTGEGAKTVVDMKKFNDKANKMLDKVFPEVVLHSISQADLEAMEGRDYYEQANKDGGIMEYIICMGRLIVDPETEKEDKAKEKAKNKPKTKVR